jgi:hypothetical protein
VDKCGNSFDAQPTPLPSCSSPAAIASEFASPAGTTATSGAANSGGGARRLGVLEEGVLRLGALEKAVLGAEGSGGLMQRLVAFEVAYFSEEQAGSIPERLAALVPISNSFGLEELPDAPLKDVQNQLKRPSSSANGDSSTWCGLPDKFHLSTTAASEELPDAPLKAVSAPRSSSKKKKTKKNQRKKEVEMGDSTRTPRIELPNKTPGEFPTTPGPAPLLRQGARALF